jgi:hypothetical protein
MLSACTLRRFGFDCRIVVMYWKTAQKQNATSLEALNHIDSWTFTVIQQSHCAKKWFMIAYSNDCEE